MTPKLFNSGANQKAEEIKRNLPVNLNTDFKTIAPFIAQVEQKYILPILGKQLFDALVLYYEQAGTAIESYEKLLDYVQYATIYIAYWYGFDIISVSLSDAGAGTKIEGDKRLYRYQEDNIKSSLKNQGFDQIDLIVSFLEDNITTFPDFAASEYYPVLQNSLVPDTTTFNQFYYIDNSRLVFVKMRPYIEQTQEIDLCEQIGREMLEDMIEHKNAPKYVAIMRLIQGFLVFKSLFYGITELGKLPTERGIMIEKNTTTGTIAGLIQQPINSKELETTQRIFNQKAESYMAACIRYIKTHKNEYPSFVDFAGEDAPEDSVIRRDNTNKSIFWT
jgi:hypothetical protein